jgi:prepilin-type N-terminal cleavage/methylation domain-containing protein
MVRAEMPAIRGLVQQIRRGSSAAGFTLIEMVVAMTLFALVASSMITVLTSAGTADALSRQKAIALELAQQQIEYVRQLNYSDVGTKSGNPPGSVLSTQQKQVSGLSYTLTTRIKFVNDPVPTSFAAFANYKQVRVTVTRTRDGKQLTQVTTYVSSSSRSPTGGLNNGVINVTVKDYQTQTPLGGAQVMLTKTWDAGYSAGDVTDNDTGSPTFGQVTFAGLEATPTSPVGYYGVTASLTGEGYEPLSDDLPPADPANLSLAPSGTTNTTIRLYKPCNVDVQIMDDANPGNLYIGQATVTLSSASRSRQASVVTTNGQAHFDTIGTGADQEKIVPASDYMVTVNTPDGRHGELAAPVTVPDDYAGGNYHSTIVVNLGTEIIPQTATVTVIVTYRGSPTAGALVTLDDNPDHSPPFRQSINTDSSGQAVFTGVPLGTYDITASQYISHRTRQGGLANQNVSADVTYTVPIA